MLLSDGLLRVFWPYDLPRSSSPGVIVGWRNSELDLFVLTVLEDVEVSCLLGEGHMILRNSVLIALLNGTATQCRQCASRRYSLSEQPTSNRSHLCLVRPITYARPRLDESAVPSDLVQSLPSIREHTIHLQGSSNILSSRHEFVGAGYHV
jgi:hypothetical protein